MHRSGVRARLALVLHYRVCPECEEEFRPDILTCSDCGAALEERWENEDGEVLETPEGPDPEAGAQAPGELEHYRPLVTSGAARQLVPHAERLKEHGIAFHMAEVMTDSERHVATYHILVHEDDRAKALDAVADLIDPGTDAELIHAVESRFQEGMGYLECPACGASQERSATECPDCGLAMAPAMDLAPCPACGAPLALGEERCGACGREAAKNA